MESFIMSKLLPLGVSDFGIFTFFSAMSIASCNLMNGSFSSSAWETPKRSGLEKNITVNKYTN